VNSLDTVCITSQCCYTSADVCELEQVGFINPEMKLCLEC